MFLVPNRNQNSENDQNVGMIYDYYLKLFTPVYIDYSYFKYLFKYIFKYIVYIHLYIY